MDRAREAWSVFVFCAHETRNTRHETREPLLGLPLNLKPKSQYLYCRTSTPKPCPVALNRKPLILNPSPLGEQAAQAALNQTCPHHPSPNPKPCTLHPTLHTLHPTPYTLHPTPYTLHPTPYTLNPTPQTVHPSPFALHPKPNP